MVELTEALTGEPQGRTAIALGDFNSMGCSGCSPKLPAADEIETLREFPELIDPRTKASFGAAASGLYQSRLCEAIKALARRANVEKIDAGPKGAVISFRNDEFADPQKLITFISERGRDAKVRPDMKVVFLADWQEAVRFGCGLSRFSEFRQLLQARLPAALETHKPSVVAFHDRRVVLRPEERREVATEDASPPASAP